MQTDADPVADPGAMSEALLAWYDRSARVLPWRVPPGSSPGDGAPRPVSRLALRGHAPADHGRRRRALLPALPRALADRLRPRRRARRRGHGRLGRPRLLRPRPQPPCLRARRRRARRRLSGHRSRPARAPRRRRLYRRRRRRHRLRPPGGRRRRQRRARHGPPARRGGAASRRQVPPLRSRGRGDAGSPPRRPRAGGDGPRRHPLHPQAPGLRHLPAGPRLPRPSHWYRRDAPPQGRQGGEARPPRHRLARGRPGRGRPRRDPPARGSPRRHARASLRPMGTRALRRAAAPGRLARPRRRGPPHLHPLPPAPAPARRPRRQLPPATSVPRRQPAQPCRR